MNKINFKDVGFLYKLWYRIFELIESVSPFSILRKYVFKNVKQFSDKWVLFNTLFSLITLLLLHYNLVSTIGGFILIYAAIRILEIVVYQINVLLFHPYKSLIIDGKKEYKLQNPYRSVVLLGHNFVEVVFWFTALTTYLQPNGDRLLFKLMDNTIRIFTLNYDKVTTNQSLLQMIFFVEVLCGMVLTIISLAKFIGELPHVHLTLDKE